MSIANTRALLSASRARFPAALEGRCAVSSMDPRDRLWLELIFPHCASAPAALLALRAVCRAWLAQLNAAPARLWLPLTMELARMSYAERAGLARRGCYDAMRDCAGGPMLNVQRVREVRLAGGRVGAFRGLGHGRGCRTLRRISRVGRAAVARERQTGGGQHTVGCSHLDILGLPSASCNDHDNDACANSATTETDKRPHPRMRWSVCQWSSSCNGSS